MDLLAFYLVLFICIWCYKDLFFGKLFYLRLFLRLLTHYLYLLEIKNKASLLKACFIYRCLCIIEVK